MPKLVIILGIILLCAVKVARLEQTSAAKKPTYLIHLGQSVTPGLPFPIIVTLFESQSANVYMRKLPPLIEASLVYKGKALDSKQIECPFGATINIELQVPSALSSVASHVKLVLEGNHYGSTKGSIFSHKSNLSINRSHPKKIYLQASQGAYFQGETVLVRAIVLSDDGRPWLGSVDALLCNPVGDAAERWVRKVTHHGVVDFEYQLTNRTKVGQWHFTVTLKDLKETVGLWVLDGEHLRFNDVRLDIKPDSQVVAFDETLYGSAFAFEVKDQVPVQGLFQMDAFLVECNNRSSDVPSLVKELSQMSNPHGETMMRFPLQGLGQIRWSIDVHKMWANSHIYEPNGCLGIVGHVFTSKGQVASTTMVVPVTANPFTVGFLFNAKVIHHSIPFELRFWLRRFDGSMIKGEDLEASLVEVTVSSGSVHDVHTLPVRYTGFHDESHQWKTSLILNELFGQNKDLSLLSRVQIIGKLSLNQSGKVSEITSIRDVPVKSHTTEEGYLSLSTSSDDIQVGDNIIFHARSDMAMSDMQFLLVSLSSGRIITQKAVGAGASKLVTFDQKATDEMAPRAKASIWQIEQSGKIRYAECLVEVRSTTRKIGLEVHANVTNAQNVLHMKSSSPATVLTQIQAFPDLSQHLSSQMVHHSSLTILTDSEKKPELSTRTHSIHLPNGLTEVGDMKGLALASWNFWKTIRVENKESVTVDDRAFQGKSMSDINFKILSLDNQGFTSSQSQHLRINRLPKLSLHFTPNCKVGYITGLTVTVVNYGDTEHVEKYGVEKSSNFELLEMGYEETLIVPPRSSVFHKFPVKILHPGETSLQVRFHSSKRLLKVSTRAEEPESLKKHCRVVNPVELTGSQYFVEDFQESCLQDVPELSKVQVSIISSNVGPLLRRDLWTAKPFELMASSPIRIVYTLKAIMAEERHNASKRSEMFFFQKQMSTSKLLKDLFQTLLAFKSSDGFFSYASEQSIPSTWLTAEALDILLSLQSESNDQYVDPMTLESSLTWLLEQQTGWGSFQELHLGKLPSEKEIPAEFREVSLTANILSLLSRFAEQETHWKVNEAIESSTRFLVKHLVNLDWKTESDDSGTMLSIAMAARALRDSKYGGVAAETAFEILAKNAQEKGGFMYWGDPGDSVSIRATSVALEVYAARRELLTTQIARWLNVQATRLAEENYMDIIYALQALMIYEDKTITSDTSGISGRLYMGYKEEQFQITDQGIVRKESLLSSNGGNVSVELSGQGYAVILMEVQWNVPYRNGVTTQGIFSDGPSLKLHADIAEATKFKLTLDVCTSWSDVGPDGRVGPIVLEFEVPPCFQWVKPAEHDYESFVFEDRVELLLPKIMDGVCMQITLKPFCNILRPSTSTLIKVWDLFEPEFSNSTYVVYPHPLSFFCSHCARSAQTSKVQKSNPALALILIQSAFLVMLSQN